MRTEQVPARPQVLGSVTLHALHESRCPVAVVPVAVGTGRDVRPSPAAAHPPEDGGTAVPVQEASSP